jgi:hypothetical protein
MGINALKELNKDRKSGNAKTVGRLSANTAGLSPLRSSSQRRALASDRLGKRRTPINASTASPKQAKASITGAA